MGESEELPEQGWFRVPLGGDEIQALYVGIDPAQEYAWREVGVNNSGNIIHRCPDKRFPSGGYGWFDPHSPPVSLGTPISRDEFEALWSQPPVLPPRRRHWWSRRPAS